MATITNTRVKEILVDSIWEDEAEDEGANFWKMEFLP